MSPKNFLCLLFIAAPLAAQQPTSAARAGAAAALPKVAQPTAHDAPAVAGTRDIKPGYAAPLPSNHALIITVSEYPKSPLPGVLTDRKLGIELARRFGVPTENIIELSEQQVTREGLKQAFADLNQSILPGDKLYVYYSGHGARYFNRATNQCTESLVMQDMHVVSNTEFAAMIRPLAAKTDKTLVMLDSCHSGGVASAAGSRSLSAQLRPKFSPDASSPQCSVAVNEGSFAAARGVDFHTTDHNLVILAAARNNEVAWDTSKGGAMTYNFEQCLAGGAADTDKSGSLSMDELTACVQARLDKTQEEAARQHATLAGNGTLVPAMGVAAPAGPPTVPSPAAAAAASPVGPATPAAPSPVATPPPSAVPGGVDIVAALTDIYNQRDDRWQVDTQLGSPLLKIGSNLSLTLRSQRDGYVYIFYRGTTADSFYLLFPNQLDPNNTISANQPLQLPRKDWNVTALGPTGTDHLMVMVTDTPRNFSALSLPAAYVSQSGPFEKIAPSPAALNRISQAALLSASLDKPECSSGAKRDLGVAKRCSNVFGASVLSVEETN